jgi:hypothetical protein
MSIVYQASKVKNKWELSISIDKKESTNLVIISEMCDVLKKRYRF